MRLRRYLSLAGRPIIYGLCALRALFSGSSGRADPGIGDGAEMVGGVRGLPGSALAGKAAGESWQELLARVNRAAWAADSARLCKICAFGCFCGWPVAPQTPARLVACGIRG